MEKDKEFTRVVFRVWSDWASTGDDVVALFPDTFNRFGECDSYMHVGQHASADYQGIIKHSRLAKPKEYAALKTELESIGYKLRVVKRRTR